MAQMMPETSGKSFRMGASLERASLSDRRPVYRSFQHEMPYTPQLDGNELPPRDPNIGVAVGRVTLMSMWFLSGWRVRSVAAQLRVLDHLAPFRRLCAHILSELVG